MKKKIFFMLSALVVALPLSLSLQSCSDDDDEQSVNNVVQLGGDNNSGNASGSYEASGDVTNIIISLDTCGYLVDLDLPSGIKWASRNLGASSPEEYGDYYAWGETEPKEDYGWCTYMDSLVTSIDSCGAISDPLRHYIKGASLYNVADTAGVADGIGGTKFDAAYVISGRTLRMPTKAEMDELLENCVWTKLVYRGVNGYAVTSKTNGSSIFLPAAGRRYVKSLFNVGASGFYWSSTPDEYVYDLYFEANYTTRYYVSRIYGHTIRPVSE